MQTQMIRRTPKLTHCDQCNAPLPDAVVADLKLRPRFHVCTSCAAKGHVMIGLASK